MGGVIDDIAGLWGGGREDKAIDQANQQLGQQMALWERQFGPVNDKLREEMLKVLQPEWGSKFKDTMRTEIESGIRPGEEAARASLMDKVRANPRGMSGSAYAKGLKDIVAEGSKARGTAFRSGMTQAELAPMNLALSFMGRTPYSPKSDTQYPPNYTTDVEGLKMMGGGLNEMYNLYKSQFGPRADSVGGGQGGVPISSDYGSTGFEEYGWD